MKTKIEKINPISAILRGEFISKKNNIQFIPFLLMVVSLVLLNIRSSFYAEKLLKESISLEKEVADLRLVYITTKSELMSMHRRSVIEDIVADQGLYTSSIVPEIIEIDER